MMILLSEIRVVSEEISLHTYSVLVELMTSILDEEKDLNKSIDIYIFVEIFRRSLHFQNIYT